MKIQVQIQYYPFWKISLISTLVLIKEVLFSWGNSDDSIVSPANCGYAELSPPANDSVPALEALGDSDLPVQGTTFTFRCPPGWVLMGPNSTTCTETGEWEPDPSEAMCMGKSGMVKHFKFYIIIIILCSCM